MPQITERVTRLPTVREIDWSDDASVATFAGLLADARDGAGAAMRNSRFPQELDQLETHLSNAQATAAGLAYSLEEGHAPRGRKPGRVDEGLRTVGKVTDLGKHPGIRLDNGYRISVSSTAGTPRKPEVLVFHPNQLNEVDGDAGPEGVGRLLFRYWKASPPPKDKYADESRGRKLGQQINEEITMRKIGEAPRGRKLGESQQVNEVAGGKKVRDQIRAAIKMDQKEHGTSFNQYERTRMELEGDAAFERQRAEAAKKLKAALEAVEALESYKVNGRKIGYSAYDNPENLYATDVKRAIVKLLKPMRVPVKFVPVGGWKQAPELAKVWPSNK